MFGGVIEERSDFVDDPFENTEDTIEKTEEREDFFALLPPSELFNDLEESVAESPSLQAGGRDDRSSGGAHLSS
jgi:hypothetical protein